jgi:hypoxanthine phosphoribosyltransferase
MYDMSWNEFEKLCVDLSFQIKKYCKLNNKKYDLIITINRGGLLIGRLLSEILKVDLAVISARHVNKKYVIDKKISSIKEIQGNILLVDDILEDSSKLIVDFIKQNYKKVKSIDLASIFYRPKLNFKPDFYINSIKESKESLWVAFPYQNKSLKTHADL